MPRHRYFHLKPQVGVFDIAASRISSSERLRATAREQISRYCRGSKGQARGSTRVPAYLPTGQGSKRGYRISAYAAPIIFQIAPLSFTLRPSDPRTETRRSLVALSVCSPPLPSPPPSFNSPRIPPLSSRYSLQPSRRSPRLPSRLVSSGLLWSRLRFSCQILPPLSAA